MRIKSIQTKIAALAGVCLFGSASILVGYGVFSAFSNETFVTEKVSHGLGQFRRQIAVMAL
jgi:methyl-accepting chemotaxis protein